MADNDEDEGSDFGDDWDQKDERDHPAGAIPEECHEGGYADQEDAEQCAPADGLSEAARIRATIRRIHALKRRAAEAEQQQAEEEERQRQQEHALAAVAAARAQASSLERQHHRQQSEARKQQAKLSLKRHVARMSLAGKVVNALRSSRVLGTDAVEWQPPSLGTAKAFEEANHPRMADPKDPSKPLPWPVCSTATGRHCPRCWDACILSTCCCPCERTSVSQLAQYGSGVSLYFQFIKTLTCVFCLWTLLTVPSLIMFSYGVGAFSSGANLALDVTTVGNLGEAQNESVIMIPLTDCGSQGDCTMSRSFAARIVAFCDLAGAAIFALTWLWLVTFQRREVRQIGVDHLTVNDYTVMVSPVPAHVTREQLASHFQRVSGGHKVVDVYVHEHNKKLMDLLERRGTVLQKLLRLQDTVAIRTAQGRNCRRHKRRIARGEKLAAEIYETAMKRQLHSRRALAAFITFNSQQGADEVLELYRYGSACYRACLPGRLRLYAPPEDNDGLGTHVNPMAQAAHGDAAAAAARGHRRNEPSLATQAMDAMTGDMKTLFPGFGPYVEPSLAPKRTPENNYFKVTVTRAPPPSSINWENLSYGNASRFGRRCITSIASVFLLLASAAIAVYASVRQEKASSAAGDALGCEEDAEGNSRHSLAVLRAHAQADSDKIICYCRQVDASAVVNDPICEDWLKQQYAASIVVLVASVAVIAINTGLFYLLKWFSHFERHHSVDSQQRSFATRLFVAQVVNTGLVVLLVNAYIPFLPNHSISGIAGVSNHKDFTSDWFAQVGVSIIITMAINIIQPFYETGGMFYVWMRQANCGLCNFGCGGTAASQPTQRALNELFLGPSFHLDYRLSALMVTVCVCMAFSAGMPALNGICFLSLLLIFWVDKYLLLRFYRTPPTYSHALADAMTGLLPYALLVHLGFGAWMLSNANIFSTQEWVDQQLSPVFDKLSSSNSTSGSELLDLPLQGVSQRLTQVHVIPFVLGFAGILALVVLMTTLGGLTRLCCRCLAWATCGLIESEEAHEARMRADPHSQQLIPYIDAVMAGALTGLPSYAPLLSPALQQKLGITARFAARISQATRLRDVLELKIPAPRVIRADYAAALRGGVRVKDVISKAAADRAAADKKAEEIAKIKSGKLR